MLDTFQEIWGAIQRNRLRTIATGFAVASGIFLLIVLQGASNGIINTLEINSGNLAFDILQIWGGTTSTPHDGMQEGRRIRLEEEDMNIGQDLFSENVTSTTADLSQGSLIASVDKNYMSVSLTGVYPEFHVIENIEIKSGRFINNIDMQKKRKVIVINDDNAKSFFKDKKSPINRYIKIGGINYKVVGLYKKIQCFLITTFTRHTLQYNLYIIRANILIA